MVYQNGKAVAISKAAASNTSGSGVRLESISIITPPKKVLYMVGETFDPSGIEVSAAFSNGYTILVENSDLVFNSGDPLEIGTENVIVSFCWGTEIASALQKISIIDQMNWWSPKMTSDTTPAPYVASASSCFGNMRPYLAFDSYNEYNFPYNAWACAMGDYAAWIALDFGKNKQVLGVRLKTRNYPDNDGGVLSQFPKTIYVDISEDGNTWETIYMEKDIPMQTVADIWAVTINFDSLVTVRYVRFSHLADGGFYIDNLVSIAEIEFLTDAENEEMSQDIYPDRSEQEAIKFSNDLSEFMTEKFTPVTTMATTSLL